MITYYKPIRKDTQKINTANILLDQEIKDIKIHILLIQKNIGNIHGIKNLNQKKRNQKKKKKRKMKNMIKKVSIKIYHLI